MRKSLFALAAGCLGLAVSTAPFFAGSASAATIDYIFSGTATFTLNGVDFTDAPFTLTYVSDTSTITSGGGEFFNTGVGTFVSGATTVTLTGDVNEVIANPPSDLLGFGQIINSPFTVSVEAINNGAFGSYNLATAFPLTSGSLNPPTGATFATSGGDLVFTDESFGAVSFQATGGVPEASTWAMMLAGFAGLGFLAYRKRGVLAAA
jgi:hypothetical protein